MDQMSIVDDTEQTQFCPQTDRRTRWNQYTPFQLRWSVGLHRAWVKSYLYLQIQIQIQKRRICICICIWSNFKPCICICFWSHRIWCIWQIRFQIHFFPGMFSKHKFMEHKHTWIFFINMLKSAILFQNKCRGLIFLIPIGDCVCALDLACQWVCDKPLAELYWHRPLCNATWAS